MVSRDASAKSVGVIVVQSSFLCVKRISCLSCSMHVACALVRAGFSCVGVRSKSVCASPSEVSESELMASVLLVFVCVRSQNCMSCLACFFAKLFLMAAWILAACEVLVVGNCVARRGRCVVGGGVTLVTSGLVFVVAVVKGGGGVISASRGGVCNSRGQGGPQCGGDWRCTRGKPGSQVQGSQRQRSEKVY